MLKQNHPPEIARLTKYMDSVSNMKIKYNIFFKKAQFFVGEENFICDPFYMVALKKEKKTWPDTRGGEKEETESRETSLELILFSSKKMLKIIT